MTKLTDILKQFRQIQPDPKTALRSRALILQSETEKAGWLSSWSFSRILIQGTEPMAAMVLAGLLLAVLVGGLPLGKFLTPLKMASLDPSSLKAEAQAIDIQIQLAGLTYPESVGAIAAQESVASQASTAVRSGVRSAPQASTDKPSSASQTENPETAAKYAPEISIDEALDLLIAE